MKAWLSIAVCIPLLASAIVRDLDIARQALSDGVWESALMAADSAATNAADRTEARLVALEALARMEDDAEIRRRLAAWTGETDEHFRYWRARMLARIGDFQQSKEALAKPFADPALALPVLCLKASMLAATGNKTEALDLISAVNLEGKVGAAVEDALLIRGELLGETGKIPEACEVLRPLAKKAERKSVQLRAGYLLGFNEMTSANTRTVGVARVRALLRKDPGASVSVAASRAFADRLLDDGDFAGAEDEYRRYLEVFPPASTDPDVLNRRGRALLKLGRNSEAAGSFARAEQSATNTALKVESAFLQAEALLADNRYLDAARCYERCVGYDGADAAHASFAEANALERASEIERAEGIYAKLADQGGAWGAKAMLRRASIAVRRGRMEDAIKSYTDLINATNSLSERDLTSAYLGRGRAYYRDYRFKDAAADFGIVAKRAPEKADGMRYLSVLCLYGDGKSVNARAEAVALMDSTNDKELKADLMLWCAKYDFNHGEYAEARNQFEKYAELRADSPKSVEALLWAARCSTALTEYSKAVELATQVATNTNAAASDRTIITEALLVQGEAVMELGRYAEAAQVFDRAAKQAGDGQTAVKAAVLKADALYAMGAGDLQRYEDAIEAYRSLPEGAGLTPDRQIEVAFKIGRALEKLRRTKEAMDQYYKNVVLAYSEAMSKEVLFGIPARTFFSRAAFSLADYYGTAGDMHAARKVLERVVAADVPAAEEARRRLAALNGKGDSK